MHSTNWLKSHADPQLEQEAARKIALVQEYEKEMPGVLIIHDLVTNAVVYMSRRGLEILNVTLEEIQMDSAAYHARFFNEEDAAYYSPLIFRLAAGNHSDEMVSYFQQVRASPEQPWMWYLSATKIFLRDGEGKARLIITIALPVDTQHPITTKVEKLLEENSFLRSNHHIYASLTRREKEILKRMALGESSQEIAAQLHISETTANTHRRNIRKKINAQTHYDITRFARAFDLI